MSAGQSLPAEVRLSDRGVREFLDGDTAHEAWIRAYRSGENEPFFEAAFDWALPRLGAHPGDLVHDLGCGSAQHTVRLARRGHHVVAVDFSRSALDLARRRLRDAGVDDHVEWHRADLTRLDLPGGSVRAGICWGVLMHVPRVEAAVAELARVLAPGGRLLVSEANRHAPENVLQMGLKRLLRRGTPPRPTAAGIEYWTEGPLVTRQADPRWLATVFARGGARLVHRRAGQLTELYTRVPIEALRRGLHVVNRAWFRRVGLPGPAYGNLMIFEKE